jgi:hypothetical protein
VPRSIQNQGLPKDIPAAPWQADRGGDRLQGLRRLLAVTTGGTKAEGRKSPCSA